MAGCSVQVQCTSNQLEVITWQNLLECSFNNKNGMHDSKLNALKKNCRSL